jgi:Protein of unknown function (DUF998)
MTSTIRASASAAISTKAARLAMVAIVSYQVLLIALIFLRPDLAPSWHTISEWAIGPYGWIMSSAFLLSALSYGALFVMLKSQLHGGVGRVGLGLLLICVIGETAVGIFTTDPMPLRFPLSTRESVGAPSFCSASYQPWTGSQQRSMESGSASSTLDRWLTIVWLFKLCGLHGYFCISLRTGGFWPRG